jgi:hypothetical protein
MSNKEVYNKVKRALHDFYQVIKASDEHERFVFMTGVSRFQDFRIISVFSIKQFVRYNNGQ